MLCVLIVECMSVVVNVMLFLMSVINPASSLCNLSVCMHGGEAMYFRCFGFRGKLVS